MPKKYLDKYRIEPNRFQFWDYSSPGSYFITICISGMVNVLGKIVNDNMQLSERGEIVNNEILEIKNYNNRLKLDSWQIMPNHVHLILTIVENPDVKKIHEFSHMQPKFWNQQNYNENPTHEEFKLYRKQRRKMIIPKAIGKFKTKSSKQINRRFGSSGWSNWQLNYHDHIIRDKGEYHKIKYYIINNPKNWDNDKFFNKNI